MKGIEHRKYGNPEVLEYKELPKPEPKEDEVLIEVKAASLNPAEWHMMRATIWMVRFSTGLRKPKNTLPGADLSGVVIAKGAKVTRFEIGDRVFGRNTRGAFAEFACLEEERAALIPDNSSYEEGASTPLAAITALIALRDHGEVEAGQHVLINGASGGIGTMAIQLARHFGAEVTAVCSSKNEQLVRSLGADHVIAYDREDFAQHAQRYDRVIDLIGNRQGRHLSNVMKKNGRAVVAGYWNFPKMLGIMLTGLRLKLFSKKKLIVMNAEMRTEDLELLAKLLDDGALKPVIDRRFSLQETPDAFRYLGTRRAKGKIMIQVGHDITE